MTTIANVEIEIFGKITKVDSNGYFVAPNGESFKAFVVRSKFLGRRRNMSEVLEKVADLFQQGKTGSEIAGICDRDTDTIGKYKKMIIALGGLDVNAIVQKREQEGEFRNEKTAAMLARFPQVAKWQERLMNKPKASKKKIRSWANCINRVCQAVKMSPIGLLQKGYTGDEQLNAIDELMALAHKTITSEASFYTCRMAVRSWVGFNQIAIPRPCTYANLSGQVVSSHGQAADVRMNKQEIEQANAILENPKSKLPYPERRIDTEVFFKFGVETCARQMAIITAKISDIQGAFGGWNSAEQVFKVIERKLYHVGKHQMKKRIFCPELVRIINARQKAGEKCLIGKQNEYVHYSQMENESTDDINQTKAQTKALQELDANLRAVYEQVGGNAADKYFTKKPSHSLRHVGAQYWLRKSNFDYGFVAELGGWTTLTELQKSYGGMPKEVFDKKYGEYIHSGE